MADVFISYEHRDRELARALDVNLRAAGFSTWWDRSLAAGDNWDDTIRTELAAARCVLVLWSRQSWDSRWVRAEAMDAYTRDILVAAKIDDAPIGVPFNLIQAADLRAWTGAEEDPAVVEVVRGVEVKLRRGWDAARARPGAIWREPIPGVPDKACPEMVTVPPGAFLMGSPESEPERDPNEGPQHEVRISYSFALGKYPVTYLEWDATLAAAGIGWIGGAYDGVADDRNWGRGLQPVINVSWHHVEEYVEILNRIAQLTGRSEAYRLPSEAEWEYACRANTTGPFNCGDSITTSQANFNGEHPYKGEAPREYRRRTTPVDLFPPNAFGLHDMHGNVTEWCADSWWPSYEGAASDGSARIVGGDPTEERLLRGASWLGAAHHLRSAWRTWGDPAAQRDFVGFRLARTVSAR